MADNSPHLPFIPTNHPDRGPGIALQVIDFEAAGVSPPFRGSRFVVAPGHSTREDVHAVAELWSIACGHGKLLYDGVEIPVQEGDFLYLAPFKKHVVINDGDDRLVICSQWWDTNAQPTV